MLCDNQIRRDTVVLFVPEWKTSEVASKTNDLLAVDAGKDYEKWRQGVEDLP